MIAYFDTSALVKLLIDEPGSALAEASWEAADVRVCATVGYTEATAAIARAWRTKRIDEPTVHRLLVSLAELWQGISRIVVDDELAHHAGALAVDHGLRGYDAVHLAASLQPTATLIAADAALLVAAHDAGLDTVDVGTADPT